jgi:hypothetical protein
MIRGLARSVLVLREGGAALPLLLALVPLLLTWPLQGRVAGGEALILMGMIAIAWTVVGMRHVRVALAARELRLPRVPRMLCFTLSTLAAWTLVAMRAPIVVWHDWPPLWPEFIVYGSCMGGLCALVANSWLATLATLLIGLELAFLPAFCWPAQAASGARAQLTIVATVMLLLIAWRTAALDRALLRGWDPRRLVEPIGGGDADTLRSPLLTGWRRRHSVQSPAAAMRVVLGPLYGRPALWIVLIVAALGAMLSPVADTLRSVRTSPLLMATQALAPFLAIFPGLWLVFRIRRLAALLGEPGGEIADLALLPGLGSQREQRSALLQQALVRPLIYYGLCLGGLVGAHALFVWHARMPPALVGILAVSAAAALLLFATLSVGVLAGRLSPASAWLKDWTMCLFALPVMLSLITIDRGTWGALFGLVWCMAAAPIVVCLIAWTIRLRQRPNLLRQ